MKSLKRLIILFIFFVVSFSISLLFVSCDGGDDINHKYSFPILPQSSSTNSSNDLSSSDSYSIGNHENESTQGTDSSPVQTSSTASSSSSFVPGLNCKHVWEVDKIIPATCTKAGEVTYQCANKTCVQRKKEVIPELGHTVVTIEAEEPTCKQTGKTESQYCSVCEEVLLESEELSRVDHNFADGIECKWCHRLILAFQPNSVKYEYYICLGYYDEAYKPRNIIIPDTYKGIPVREIAEKAFYKEYGLNSVTLGKNIQSIGEFAFDACYNLLEVCNKTNITIEANSTINSENNGCIGKRAKAVYTSENYQTKLHTDEKGFIVYQEDENTRLLVGYDGKESTITLPEGITQVNSFAFAASPYVQSITLADSVNELKMYAFSQCYELRKVVFGNKPIHISRQIFYRFTEETGDYIDSILQEVISESTVTLIRKRGNIEDTVTFAPKENMKEFLTGNSVIDDDSSNTLNHGEYVYEYQPISS